MNDMQSWPILSILLVVGALPQAGTPASGALPRAATAPIPAFCDARIPIDAAHTPGDGGATFKITAAGSYFLTGNVIGEAGKNGIEVAVGVGSVTIDLNGYSLLGVVGSLDGISASGSIAIRNGSALSWGGRGFNVSQGNLDRLHAAFNGGDGYRALWGSVITNCTAEANGGDGISVADVSRISGCVCKLNQGQGIQLDGACIVSDCVIYNNAGGGILGALATIRGNELFSNAGNTIEVSGSASVTGNVIQSGTTGILASGGGNRLSDNTIQGCVTGIDVSGTGNLVVRNTLGGNATGLTIAAGNTFGPILAVGGTGDLGAVAGAQHPQANLEY